MPLYICTSVVPVLFNSFIFFTMDFLVLVSGSRRRTSVYGFLSVQTTTKELKKQTKKGAVQKLHFCASDTLAVRGHTRTPLPAEFRPDTDDIDSKSYNRQCPEVCGSPPQHRYIKTVLKVKSMCMYQDLFCVCA